MFLMTEWTGCIPINVLKHATCSQRYIKKLLYLQLRHNDGMLHNIRGVTLSMPDIYSIRVTSLALINNRIILVFYNYANSNGKSLYFEPIQVRASLQVCLSTRTFYV
jgi:hypothetical protein